jgi:ubiquinone/menaquinone biosynthesis C-methylase UbiE
LSEFTGERVIPGLVEDNLLNEHLARYRFAARFSEGAHVLDAGCGSGYGSAELSNAARVTAADISVDAIRHARENFRRPGITFLQASCEALPFADGTFDLITAFEVIEHLTHWEQLLTEAKRVLKPTGILLVSTPNKSYYAESRAAAGPNPFHTHEFEYREFEAALYGVFPHLRMWTQNHSEAIVFAPLSPVAAQLDACGDAAPQQAHFYLAACSQTEIAANDVFAWMPSSGNLLREREHHIAKLEGELEKKDAWLQQVIAEHATLQHSHEETVAELKQRNEWADRLNEEIDDRRAMIARLQQDAGEKLAWTRNLEADIAKRDLEIERLMRENHGLETDVTARTAWARSLEEQLDVKIRHVRLQAQEIEEYRAHLERQGRTLSDQVQQLDALRNERRLIANSKWIWLGRKLNVGPVVNE